MIIVIFVDPEFVNNYNMISFLNVVFIEPLAESIFSFVLETNIWSACVPRWWLVMTAQGVGYRWASEDSRTSRCTNAPCWPCSCHRVAALSAEKALTSISSLPEEYPTMWWVSNLIHLFVTPEDMQKLNFAYPIIMWVSLAVTLYAESCCSIDKSWANCGVNQKVG